MQDLSGVLEDVIHSSALVGGVVSMASAAKLLGEMSLPHRGVKADCRVKCS